MKFLSLIIAVFVAITATSCKVVGTLYPLSQNSRDFVFKKELIGKWQESIEQSVHYLIDTISGREGKLYSITCIEKSNETNITDTTILSAFLIKVNDWYYLDCSLEIGSNPFLNKKKINDFLHPRHFIFRLAFGEKDKLEVASLDTDELIRLIDEKKISLHYANLKKDDYLILDKSEILQKTLRKNKKNYLMFKNKSILKKIL